MRLKPDGDCERTISTAAAASLLDVGSFDELARGFEYRLMWQKGCYCYYSCTLFTACVCRMYCYQGGGKGKPGPFVKVTCKLTFTSATTRAACFYFSPLKEPLVTPAFCRKNGSPPLPLPLPPLMIAPTYFKSHSVPVAAAAALSCSPTDNEA